ncbi:MAG: DUF5994 family protein [Mycobacterium sp.]|nr:DUF5994 family protein [Mycobacterium sp.]
MTPTTTRAVADWDQPTPEHTPRLRLKPKASVRSSPTGFVDGAWWPASNDLLTELPDLLAVLSVRLGPISHVTYQLGEWATAPVKTVIGGRVVRLAGYRRQPGNTIEVLGLGGNSVVLLVVPAGTDAEQAHDTMMTAAAPEDASTTVGLLVASHR